MMGISKDMMRAAREEAIELIRILEDDEQDRETERSETRNYFEPSFDPTAPNTETDWEKFFQKKSQMQGAQAPMKRGSLPSFEEYLAFCALSPADATVDEPEEEAPPVMYA